MTLTPGTRFGPYEVLGPLASGGLGEVYHARDTRLSRDAALKILPAGVHLDAVRVARFEREARTLATLSHANIATLVTGAQQSLIHGGGHPRYLSSGQLAFGSGQTCEQTGTVVFLRGTYVRNAATLVWVDRDGREEPLGTPAMFYNYARLSPDERRVALDVAGPNRDIYVWDIARRVLQRLTTDPAEDAVARWTLDGSRIVYANSRHGIPNIFWQNADGSGAPERLLESPRLHQPASFTRDARQLGRRRRYRARPPPQDREIPAGSVAGLRGRRLAA